MKTNVINQIKTLLGMEVKLEMMKLADGVTILEADSFEAGMSVVIVTEDEQKIPLPVGEYDLEDGRVLIVAVEGTIAEIKEKEQEAPEVEVEVEAPEMEEPVMAEAEVSTPKKKVESTIVETFFSEMEALKKENEELKAKLETFSKVDPVAEVVVEETTEETKVELEEVKPITFNPENVNPVEQFRLASKRGMSTMDRILEKLSN